MTLSYPRVCGCRGKGFILLAYTSIGSMKNDEPI